MKVRNLAVNLAVNPDVALHWQVTEKGDGLEVWGAATVHTDLATKRLWLASYGIAGTERWSR